MQTPAPAEVRKRALERSRKEIVELMITRICSCRFVGGRVSCEGCDASDQEKE